MARSTKTFTPDPEQMKLWPSISGNTINGLGESDFARPRPIYWHDPDATPHGPLQRYMGSRQSEDHPKLHELRTYREYVQQVEVSPMAAEALEQAPQAWTAQIKQVGLACGADLIGITQLRSEWLFEGHSVPERWIIMIGVAHDYEQIQTAPAITAGIEVGRQYTRGTLVAKGIASFIQERGHAARLHASSAAGSITLIPPALACGFGELGKHGSIIHRRLGASFRLAAVLTDLPLIADQPDGFGVDDFCTNCRTCSDACPPDAMIETKQTVRGALKWYVDFDKCLPYFNESHGCGICVAVCPWSRPGAASRLLIGLARRRERAEAAE